MPGPLIRTDIEAAEMVKYTDNVWHAVKVGFANEIGNICKALEIDGHKVMDIFCQDTKLNLSPYYMKPGFAFGGSCLPKDVRALTYKARMLDLELPLLNSVLPSNRLQVEKGIRIIVGKGSKEVGILGFSFKAGTDDLRESPMVDVIEHLVGANRDFIFNYIPHISHLMVDSMDEVLAHGRTIVVGNGDPEFKGVLSQLKDNQVLVDFVRIMDSSSIEGRYGRLTR